MKKDNFLKIFLATIIIIRLILYLIPKNSFIYTDSLHHIHIGIILLILYFLIRNITLLAITLGLIVDQITQVPFYLADLIGFQLAQKQFWSYWSPYSIISTIIVIIVSVTLIKKYKK